MRGALIWPGQADPVDSVKELEQDDPVRETRATIFAALVVLPRSRSDGNRDSGYTTPELINQTEGNDELRNALLQVARGREGHLDIGRLGYWLRGNRNTRVGRWKLVRSDGRPYRWRIQFAVGRGGMQTRGENLRISAVFVD